MIWTDGYGLLVHMQRIDWVKALEVYFIDKEMESAIRQGFPFTICPIITLCCRVYDYGPH